MFKKGRSLPVKVFSAEICRSVSWNSTVAGSEVSSWWANEETPKSGMAISEVDKCGLKWSGWIWDEAGVMNSSSTSRAKLDKGSSFIFLGASTVSGLIELGVVGWSSPWFRMSVVAEAVASGVGTRGTVTTLCPHQPRGNGQQETQLLSGDY